MIRRMPEINTKKLDLRKVFLSFKNPRWEPIPNLNTNLIGMIMHQSDKKTEKEVIKKLFELEGDLRDFVDLLSSIAKGFRDYEQSMFVVQKNNSQYVVAEGNRRILALKLLNKIAILPEISEIGKNYDYDPDDDWDQEYSLASEKKYLENYDKIKKIIDAANATEKRTEFNFVIINENQNYVLWEIIYSRHVSGTKIGARRWGRGKYFVDLLNFFPRGMEKKYEKFRETEIESKLQKRLTKIKMDYKQAQFVFEVANADLQDKNKAKEWMEKQAVSALQYNHCLYWLKKVAQNYDYNDKDFDKFIFKFDYKDDYFLIFEYDEDKIIKPKEMLIFIKKWFKKNMITTRTNLVDYEKYYEFSADFGYLIGEDVTANPFFWDKDQIEKEFAKTQDQSKKKYFETLWNIKDKQEKISQQISNKFRRLKGFWAKTIKDLEQQLSYNTKNNLKYIHTSSLTVRSILEILTICSLFFDSDVLKPIVEQITKRSKIKFETENGKELDLKEKFCVLFLIKHVKISQITYFLKDLFKINKGDSVQKIIANIMDKSNFSFLDKFTYFWEKRIFMNEIIYNHFRILRTGIKDFIPILEQLKIIEDLYGFVGVLIENLDIIKLSLVDQKIMDVNIKMKNNEIRTISINETNNF